MGPKPRRGSERRREPRIEVDGELVAHLLSPRALAATLVDFSAGGLCLDTAAPLAIGKRHRPLVASHHTGPSLLTANVAYCRPKDPDDLTAGFLAGLTFVDLDDAGRASVDRFLDELTSSVVFELPFVAAEPIESIPPTPPVRKIPARD
jgi:hypothetical protein